MKKLANPSVVEKAVREHGITGDYEVGVYQASVEEMKKLWDGKPHDVLSFPLEKDQTYPDGVTRLGDIVVCETDMDRFESLVKHACLHLLGIHHE
ncbi:MAG: hypothetical protein UW73_C0025G0008 [Microgenomates group bacterium GW2011_GWB1_44_8]|nr:MAG: hypothetical protein UW73_C0025G0008 [Microgenomates group bacterium GW2011_GWB1_44_8]